MDSVKMCEKLTIIQVEQARCIIGKRVRTAWDIIVSWHITMDALMDPEQAQEVRWDLVGCCIAFALPVQGS
jgi:hypothetical protein